MDWKAYGALVGTVVAPLIVSWIWQVFQWRSRVLWWWVHSYGFRWTPAGGQELVLQTGTACFWNKGRKSAVDLEVVWSAKPVSMEIHPPRAFHEETNPAGQYVLRFPSLGPRESFWMYALNPDPSPQLLSVRWPEGGAAELSSAEINLWQPRWKTAAYKTFALLGVGAVAFIFVYGALRYAGPLLGF